MQRARTFLIAGPILLLLLSACHSTRTGSASFASVTILGRSVEEIQKAAIQIFREEGYETFSAPSGEMMFQKEGSRMNALARGGLVATHYGAETWVRVKANVVDLSAGKHRLQCQAFMVPNKGDSFFEDEQRLANFRSGPYQELLDKVQALLK